jgi:hypothetical protein
MARDESHYGTLNGKPVNLDRLLRNVRRHDANGHTHNDT